MNQHAAQHAAAMNFGNQFFQHHRDMIDQDNAIRLSNARKNAEAIARQRRYDQAMASEQADRNLKERLAEIQAETQLRVAGMRRT